MSREPFALLDLTPYYTLHAVNVVADIDPTKVEIVDHDELLK